MLKLQRNRRNLKLDIIVTKTVNSVFSTAGDKRRMSRRGA